MDNASFCLKCKKKSNCIKICPELEVILPKKTTGRNKREILFNPTYLDMLENRTKGKHKRPIRYDN